MAIGATIASPRCSCTFSSKTRLACIFLSCNLIRSFCASERCEVYGITQTELLIVVLCTTRASIASFASFCLIVIKNGHLIGPIRILGIGLDLAWSGGSCGGIHWFTYEKIPPQEPPLHARSNPIPRIRIGPICLRQKNYAFLRTWPDQNVDLNFPLNWVFSSFLNFFFPFLMRMSDSKLKN